MDFEKVYARYASEISLLAKSQHVPGLDVEDIASEMTVALWKATQTYDNDSDLSFGQWWWSLWLNRRSDLSEAFYAAKRVHPTPVDPQAVRDALEAEDRVVVMPPCPSADVVDNIIWRMLAEGSNALEVMSFTEISKRAYYSTIRGWRTPEVRRRLLG